jgi:ribosomal protein S18 acetylase RimI-like enzyme
VAPDEAERLKILSGMFRYRVRGWLTDSREVQLVLEDGHIVGSATWLKPQLGLESALELGLAPPPPQPGGGPPEEVFSGLDRAVVERWSKFQRIIEAQEQDIIPTAWELAPIAVLPEMQRKKIGAALLTKKLAVLDAAGLPCCLCTQDRINLSFYERFGFRKAAELLITEDGPVSYSMKRDPPRCLAP